jgi:hypothetical protein
MFVRSPEGEKTVVLKTRIYYTTAVLVKQPTDTAISSLTRMKERHRLMPADFSKWNKIRITLSAAEPEGKTAETKPKGLLGRVSVSQVYEHLRKLAKVCDRRTCGTGESN